ncbi:hypothetical protein BC739_009310 [Kutzneria viridogrisea]|nr:hypothetical protein [Kutzneria viridogrisea]
MDHVLSLQGLTTSAPACGDDHGDIWVWLTIKV